MSKFTTLFAPAALALMASATPVLGQQFHPSDETRAAGQTGFAKENSGPNCVRDDFGFCAPPQQHAQEQPRSSAFDSMVSYCGGRQWSDRWGQQIDNRVRGSLNGSVFESMGSPYGRFRAQQTAACQAREQMYNLSVRYNRWDNVPPDMQRNAERAWVMATQIGPQRQFERQIGNTWNRQQRRWANDLSRRLGF